MQTSQGPWYRRPSRVIPLSLLTLGVIATIVWVASPWPAALLIRAMFERGAVDTVAEAEQYAPVSGVDARLDIPYASAGADAGANTTLDLYTPAGATEPLPVVVWIHGGAWISGDKSNIAPYARILADRGYAVVTLNYAVAPEAIYPTAVDQVNMALGFVDAHADEFGIDRDRIVLAGDSAGAQLASQLANIITNPAFASEMQLTPTLAPDQLAGIILNCGVYDVSGIPNAPGIGGWGFRISLWSYLGERDWSQTPGGREMSSLEYVTADFPPTWISGGNGDPLTAGQSKPLAARLDALGVPVTPVFYADDHEPALAHEYQFHLDGEDARAALESTVAFLDQVTG